MSFEHFLDREYKMPLNIPEKHKYNYIEILDKGYGKYLDIISSCGNVIMLNQFVEIVSRYHPVKYSNYRSYSRVSEPIVIRLMELGFIDVGIMGKFKYIYLKQPSLALVYGDYKTHYRAGVKNTINANNLMYSINKVQALLDYNVLYDYYIMHNQLMEITIEIYDLIVKSGNKYGYDTDKIKHIIELGTYERIKDYLNDDSVYDTKIGVIKTLWEDLAKGYCALGRKRQTINSIPFYKKVHIQDDGLVTLHYVPEVIIYDVMKNQQYYEVQSNLLFKIFFKLRYNATDELKNEYLLNNSLGATHLNRIGYVVKIIGNNEDNLKNAINIMDAPYYDDKYTHTPIVKNSTPLLVNTIDYFMYSNTSNVNNEVFHNTDNYIDKLIDEQKGE